MGNFLGEVSNNVVEIKAYWLLVYHLETGDFLNAGVFGINEGQVKRTFEKKYPYLTVIRMGEGSKSPKPYTSLPYANLI